MIRESQSWTPSELIYLFADGEADDVQKSLLFSALANDAGLQAEFSDALRINAAIKDTGLEENPPKHVTAALFRKAGFGVAAEETSTVVGGGAAVLSGGARLTSHLRSLVIPLVSAFVGGMIALLFAPEILQHSAENNQTVVAGRGSTASAMRNPNAASYRNALPEASGAGVTTPIETARRAATSGNTVKSITIEGKKEGLQNASTLVTAEKLVENAKDPEALGSDRSGAKSLSEGPEMRKIGISSEPITVAEDVPASDELKEHTTAPVHSLSATEPKPLEVRDPRFALQVRGLADIEIFPHRSLNVGKPAAFENIAITGFYNISRSHAIGIEVGREYHPLYVPTGSADLEGIADVPVPVIDITINGTNPTGGDLTEANVRAGGSFGIPLTNSSETKAPPPTDTNSSPTSGYRLEPRTSWFGVAYQFRAAPLDRLGLIRPYVQTMIGGTQLGPIGKGTLGLSWTPDSRVSFNLGIEGTAVLYRNNGEWYSSRKLGLAYSAQVNF